MVRKRSSKNISYGVIVSIFALSLVSSFIFIMILGNALHAFLLSTLFTLCFMPWLLWKRDTNYFAPVYFTSIFLTLIYPVRTLTSLLFPGYVVSYFPPPYDSEVVTKVLLYTIIGIIIYLFVYYNPPKLLIPHFRGISLRNSLKGWPLKIVLICLAGWAVRYYQISTQNYVTFLTGEGHNPATFTLLSYFAELPVIAYILTWVYYAKRERVDVKSFLLLFVIVVPEAMYALMIQGSKSHLVRLVIFPVMAYYLTKGRLPLRILVPTMAFVVLFVFPYVQTYREIYEESFSGSLDVSLQESISMTNEALAEMYTRPGYYAPGISSDTPFWLRSFVVFLNRWAGFDGLAVVLTYVPDSFRYVYGKDLLVMPFALIPRAIWHSKPISEVQQIFDKKITLSVGSSTSPYPIAEGYFNGGLMGIVFVMFSLAFIQRILYSGFFVSRKENPLAIAVYIWLFIWVTWIDTWILPMYTYLLQRVFVLALVCLYMVQPAWLIGRRTAPKHLKLTADG